jgi:hypothetical protein
MQGPRVQRVTHRKLARPIDRGDFHCQHRRVRGFVNIAKEEYEREDNEGWRTCDNSWLDMEEEYKTAMSYVKMIIGEGERNKHMPEKTGRMRKATPPRRVCAVAVLKTQGEEEGSNDNIQTRQRKDEFQDGKKEMFPPPAKKRKQERLEARR